MATMPYNADRRYGQLDDEDQMAGNDQIASTNGPAPYQPVQAQQNGTTPSQRPVIPQTASTDPVAPPRTFAQMQAEGQARPPMPEPAANPNLTPNGPNTNPVLYGAPQLNAQAPTRGQPGYSDTAGMSEAQKQAFFGAQGAPVSTGTQFINPDTGAYDTTASKAFFGGQAANDPAVASLLQTIQTNAPQAQDSWLTGEAYQRKIREDQLASAEGTGNAAPMTAEERAAFINNGTPAATHRELIDGQIPGVASATGGPRRFDPNTPPTDGGGQLPPGRLPTLPGLPASPDDPTAPPGSPGAPGNLPSTNGTINGAPGDPSKFDILGMLTGGSQGTGAGSAVQNATQQSTLDLLKNPNPYNSQAVQDEYNWLGGNIDDEYSLKQNALDEEMARRGLGVSTNKAGRLNDLNIGKRSAKTSLATDLANKLATTTGQYQTNAINTGNTVGAAAQGGQQSWLAQLMGYGNDAFNHDLATNAVNQNAANSWQDYILQLLGAGYGGATA